MNKNEIIMAFESMALDDTQKSRILDKVLYKEQPSGKPLRAIKTHRKAWISAGAVTACLALVLTLTIMLNLGGGTVTFALSIPLPNGHTVLIEDRGITDRPAELAATVGYVDSYPQLRFFITGEDIAKIMVSCENEYLKIHDFSQTLDEKYWNLGLYYEETEIDGIIYQYIPAKSSLDKSFVLVFPEGFSSYDQVWYDWLAWDLREWASDNDFSRIQGYNGMSAKEIAELAENLTEEERLAIAAGGGGTSAAGHIQLDGYPEELLNDSITMAITDRQGNTIKKTLTINISNNAFGQTVVTASMID